MADSHGLQGSANTRSNSRNLDESLSRVVELNQESGSMMETSLSELNTSCQDRDIGESVGRDLASKSDEAYEDFLKAIKAGKIEVTDILKYISIIERDILVKQKLLKYSSLNLNNMRTGIIELCKHKFPQFPRSKPFRRLNRQGGRSATEKLAMDILNVVKFCSSGEVTSEINDIFSKPPSQGAQSFLNVMAENADEFQNLILSAAKMNESDSRRF
jgi:hypothetical protein